MSISHSLLARRPARDAACIPVVPRVEDIHLALGRVHEASGPARRSFALWLAAHTPGPVLWIAPSWGTENLNADGVCQWIDPARLIFVSPKRSEDLLWAMEEVLRSGAAALAVADLPELPSLTQVRRMHLAAQTGGTEGAHLPLGLLLTPGRGGASGVETRWHLHPDHQQGNTCWKLDRSRARTAPPKQWRVTQTQQGLSARITTA